ncbi:MAG: ABC transporter permease, partial [Myxococcota bacterium]
MAAKPNQPATFAHWLGTDEVGRDVLARILYGARTSIVLAVGAATMAAVVGGGLGALAGFFGGLFDEVVVRATEATATMPKLPLLLLLSALTVPGGAWGRAFFVVVLLAAMAWPGPARLARATAMTCRQAGYVEASTALGASSLWVWRAHVWPRVLPVLAVGAASDVAQLILLESVLSYLGFGIPEPSPSLGNLMSGGLTVLLTAPMRVFMPGIVTVLIVASLHAVADRWAARIDPYRSSP